VIKRSKSEVDYEPIAKGPDQCRDCKHFDSPRGCEAVEGLISPGAWCKLFSRLSRLARRFRKGKA
jgi:hypothetical protein